MKCFTVSLSQDGSFDVQDGIEFERTNDPNLGILKAGGLEVPIVEAAIIPHEKGQDKNVLLNVAAFPGTRTTLVGKFRVRDPFGYLTEKDYDPNEYNPTPLVLSPLLYDDQINRVIILYKFDTKIGYCQNDEHMAWREWNRMKDDLNSYGSFAKDDSSGLFSIEVTDFIDHFRLGIYRFCITFNEKNKPKVDVRKLTESDFVDELE